MATRKKIGTRKPQLTHEEKKQRHDSEFEEWTKEDYKNNLWIAENGFIVNRANRGVAKASMDDYKRFLKKFNAYMWLLFKNTVGEGVNQFY